jgi:hypothetical protein
MAVDDAARLEGMLDEFRPEIAAVARGALARLTKRLPGAAVIVYDAYNALAIGLSVDGGRRGLFLHLPVYPNWVNLGFNEGAALKDPKRLLVGEGSTVRHIRLNGPDDIDKPEIAALITQAAERAGYVGGSKTVVKIMPWNGKKRPRR